MSSELAAASLVVSAGREHQPGASLNAPLVPASNFLLGAGRSYARDDGTPTWEALENVVGALEDAHCVSFSSGMAAVSAIFDQLRVGSKIVIPDDCYQGVAGLALQGQHRGFWRVERLAVDDTAAWLHACADADLIWLESPSNPLLTVADVRAIASAKRKDTAFLVVDNTFATALNQKPLELGADFSFQSATKFIGGHSDLLLGVVSVKRPELLKALRHSRELNGATPGALEAFLATRGVRTLALRFERAQNNAATLAERLSTHPRVSLVRYPGLVSHPTHQVAREQLNGFGTIVTFDLEGDASAADQLCARVKLIQHATSLGSVESTMERRAANPGQEHLPPSLVRLSVGIEDVEDLWTDLLQALG